MRIRRSTTSPSPSPSPSSCSSSSSCFSSSSTTLHSTISTHHSLSSSSNSTSSSSSPSSTSRRCQGLDLLVKAVYYVAGSVVGVPYIQRRVIRRRKPTINFDNLVINFDQIEVNLQDVHNYNNNNVDEQEQDVLDCNIDKFNLKTTTTTKKKNNSKQKRKPKGVPTKLHDSVLQSWKPRDRRRRRSSIKS